MATAASSSTQPTPTTVPAAVSSDRAVSHVMQQGLRNVVLWTAGGFTMGGLAGLVLARGGGGTAARKVLAGLGGGVGLGSAWTRTSMQLEQLLTPVIGNSSSYDDGKTKE